MRQVNLGAGRSCAFETCARSQMFYMKYDAGQKITHPNVPNHYAFSTGPTTALMREPRATLDGIDADLVALQTLEPNDRAPGESSGECTPRRQKSEFTCRPFERWWATAAQGTPFGKLTQSFSQSFVTAMISCRSLPVSWLPVQPNA